jgi:phage terminase large subunit
MERDVTGDRKNMFTLTTGTKKILKLTKRIRGVAGGSSASKTISILLWLIDYAQSSQGQMISVVSETFPHLKRGAMRDFLNIMEQHHYFKNANWNKTDCMYEFPTHSIIEFFSADQAGKVRGPRRDVMFINEANNISYETYTQLEIRTKDIIWLDWNPVSEFWWYSEVLPKQDVDFITLTYKDNEALDPKQVDALEARRMNKNWWNVYGLGKLGDIEGRIYHDWAMLDEVPHEARLERYGLDFGYSNDPTAIVAVYKYNNGYILDEITYQKGLSNRQIYDILSNQERTMVIADSSEPKSIDELMTYGISVFPSLKGSGSVNKGIQFVQEQRISVTKRSINLIKEYRNYLWMANKDGKYSIDSPPSPLDNHCMDAIRYAINSLHPLQEEDTFDVPDDTKRYSGAYY